MAESHERYSDDSLAVEVWEKLDTLPEPGERELVDRLVERKRITHDALVRVGARYNEATEEIAYRYGEIVRFRNLITGKVRSFPPGNGYAEMKMLYRNPAEQADAVIVCEGETDAARLWSRYLDADIAVMPAGAETFKARYREQIEGYPRILVGLDNDANGAGDRGARKIMAALPQAERFSPAPANDWCDREKLPPLPVPPKPPPVVVWGAELFDWDYPEQPSYLENALLPIGGIMLLHGWKGSYKSWLVFDLAVALAEGGSWIEFETTHQEEPPKIGVLQFEIPPTYYAERFKFLAKDMERPELVSNIAHFSPFDWPPEFVTGVKKYEEKYLKLITEAGIEVMIFDPIRQMVGAKSMNDEEIQQTLVRFFKRLNAEGITVVATHHDSKSGTKDGGGGSLLSATGASNIITAADTVVSVQLPKNDDLEMSKRRNLRFKVRGAADPSPRRFEMADDKLAYGKGTWNEEGGGDDGDERI